MTGFVLQNRITVILKGKPLRLITLQIRYAMLRNYLLTLFLSLFFVVGASHCSRAQYADLGTGGLKNKIWWIDWNGFSMANGAVKTFTTSNGLTVAVAFSNVSGPLLTPTPMNTWYGAVLHLLYDFSNAAVLPALYNPSDVTTATNFTITVSATRNGVAVPLQFIAADAEASAVTEITTLTTNGSNWNTVDFFRNSSQTSNPLNGCNTSTVKISDTYGNSPSVGQNPVISTQTPSGGPLTITAKLDHSGIPGKMGLAFGILEAVDRGDLPLSYGYAQHRIQFAYANVCNYLPPLPASTQDANLKLGAVPGDADGIQSLNDNTNGTDEDAIVSFPAYAGNGTYTLTLPVTNTGLSAAYLAGWFDVNGNGMFEVGESQTATVPVNGTSATLTWTGLPASLSRTNPYGFRFRLSTDVSAVQSATGYAKDGEVEDYLVLIPQNVAVGFTAPDTVCINAPVSVANTSSNASSYYWNFCVANALTTPSGTNIGGSGTLSLPVFSDYAKDGNNYYAFVTNNVPGKLVRLSFGNSLLNAPTYTDFGDLGGAIPNQCEGIQVVYNEGKWYAIIVGGQPVGRLVKVEFGTSLGNNSPVATNWGNVGNLAYPTDLHVFQSGSNWYGLTVNSQTNSITRFSFTNSFNNPPTGINLGTLGGMNYPTGIYAVSKGGLWYAFITNAGTGVGNSTDASLTRLDFGTSLLNTPTGTNIGNPGNALSSPRDLTIYQSCNEIFGYVVGNASAKELIRLNFNNSLSAVPSASVVGNTGSLNFPHSVSKLFRVNSDLYAFVTNVNSNTVTRLQFAGCNNASIASSTLQNPPPIAYNTAGTYNINLTIDEGLPTQDAYCKQVVVVPPPTVTARPDTAICPGGFVVLTTTATNASKFSWSPATGLSDQSSPNPVASPAATTQYIVTATNGGGCSSTDTVVITVKTPQQCTAMVVNPGFTAPDTVCVNTPVTIVNTSTNASTYYWNFCVANSFSNPVGSNLGVNNNLSLPVFSDYAKDGNNYYAFVTNNVPGKLTRLEFGNSLLNVPVYTDLGNFGGVIPDQCEGIQLIKNEGKWYAIIVGGQPSGRIVKIEFGSSLSNASPLAVNWGNIGNLAYPTDLHVFQDGANWYGLTLNSQTNSITRFSFTNSFNNVPTAVNLGSFGGMNYPTGIYAISKNGNWYAFITNAGTGVSNSSDASLTRLDFGTSLLNMPTGVNLGNLGNALSSPRDITIYQSCNEIFGYVVANATSKELVRLNFNNSLTTAPSAVSIGNTGTLNFPHSVSKLFRDNSDLYAFITNVNSNSITRLKFSGCNSASIAGSTLQNPPPVAYNASGTYNINLTVDEGLPTQSAFCKQVVVLPQPIVATRPDTALCAGASVTLTTTGTGVTQYSWSPATGLSNANTASPVATPAVTTQYIVTATGAGGCVARDTVEVTVKTPQQCTSVTVTAGFIVPDTVCVNTPVNVINNSVNASSYYWNFCVANLLNAPSGQNIGNPAGAFSQPVFMDYAFDNGNYYGFLINHFPGALIRLDFGNSLLNTPTTTNLGNFGGIIPPGYGTEGIQLVFNENKWYVIVVGGYTPSGSTPRILKIEFGSSLANPSPVATNWGNLGNMLQPLDLHVFKEGNTWYGLTINAENNTITRFNFTNSFSNTPTAVNLGNIGNLNYPTGIYAISDNGFWRVFVTNAGNSTLTRLDFGSSLVNVPTGVNLGNPGNVLNQTRDLTILKQCGQIVGFAVNGNQASNETIKIDFKNDLSATPVLTSLGNLGSSSFPHSISKLFRVNDDVYAFITNVANNSITRLKFSGCTAASIAGSTAQTPTGIMYNTAGTYNINLTVDDGLPTQTAYCRQVVVVASLHTPLQTKSLCAGDSIQLTSSAASGNQWSTGSTAQSIYVKTAGAYWVQSSNGGCVNTDSFAVAVKPVPTVNLGRDTALCTSDSLVLDAGNPGAAYAWQNGQTSQTFTVGTGGLFHVTVTKDGCTKRDSIVVSSLPVPLITRSADTSICKGSSTTLTAGGGGTYNWSPATGLSISTGASTVAKPDTTTKYFIAVTGANGCRGRDSVTVTVKLVPVVNLGKDTSLCSLDSLWLDAGNAGAGYLWQNGQTTQKFLVKGGGSYSVSVNKAGCVAKDTVIVDALPSPTVTLTDNTSICRTASVVLNATGGSMYKWWPATGLSDSTGAAITASPSVTTTYYLLATGSNNCTANDSVIITVTPMPAFSVQASKPVLCIGDTAVLSAHGGDAYTWYPALWLGNPADSITQAFPPATTAYSVVIEDYTCRITDTLSVRLPVADKPTVALSKSNDINCFQGAATLFAGGGTSYFWQPAAGLSDVRSKSPVVTVSTTTTYSVLVKTAEGCEVQDSITVYVAKGDDGSGFPVPTAFTPNGDGKNDCFSVQHWGAVTEFSLNLYNRWGERVFHADAPGQCWNGVYKGVPQPGDVYVYWIKAKTLCGEVFRKGTFALIR